MYNLGEHIYMWALGNMHVCNADCMLAELTREKFGLVVCWVGDIETVFHACVLHGQLAPHVG